MPGHTIVTTRRHEETLFGVTRDEEAALAHTVAAVGRALRLVLNPDGILIQQSNGVAAFQSVPHVHVHVIPKVAGPYPPIVEPQIIPWVDRHKLAVRIKAASVSAQSDDH